MSVRKRMTRRLGLPAIGVAVIAVVAASVAFAGYGDVSPNPFGIPTKENPNPSAGINAVRGDRLWNWTEQSRSEVLARHGVVATSQPLAAQVGLQILQDGGNAADAAVATAAMLGVVEPHSAGIGGDMEAIYWSAKDRKLSALNAAGWARARGRPSTSATRG
jgi:gamma-glutamyltranspeptidase / glutathione hydrolase